MEYVIPPGVLILLLRFGLPVLITWFFKRFAEPPAAVMSQQKRLIAKDTKDTPNRQRIAATRASLDRLKQRLDDTNGS